MCIRDSAKAEALAAEQEVLLNKEVEEIQIEENYIEEQKEESVIVEQKHVIGLRIKGKEAAQ